MAGFRNLRRLARKLFSYDIWNIGVVQQDIDEICRCSRLANVVWAPRQGRYEFIADPFILNTGSSLTVLVERFEYTRTCRGRISRYELDPGAKECQMHDVLEKEYHLSYPYVFCDGEKYYCVPEMREARKCDLYMIKESGDLEFVQTMIKGVEITDPTVFFENGRWWLFCTPGGSAQLYAYHAEELGGEWIAHALNPLKCDRASSRPAGPPYRRRGDLYRPAQDCSTTYGGAVVINKILELAPDRFREEVVCRIEPETTGEYPLGFHTINVLDGVCVVDGKKVVTDWAWFFRGPMFRVCTRRRRRRLDRKFGS